MGLRAPSRTFSAGDMGAQTHVAPSAAGSAANSTNAAAARRAAAGPAGSASCHSPSVRASPHRKKPARSASCVVPAQLGGSRVHTERHVRWGVKRIQWIASVPCTLL